jgi:phage N-6-adenine-methyltransferase
VLEVFNRRGSNRFPYWQDTRIMTLSRVVFSFTKEDWQTPLYIFKELDDEFHFQLDPCTTEDNPLGTRYYYTKAEDGLSKPWNISTFVNPPYSQTKEWVKKAHDDSMKYDSTIVMLVASRTDTKWYHSFVWDETKNQCRKNVQIRFKKGRIKFNAPRNCDNVKLYSAPFPSMFVIFRQR